LDSCNDATEKLTVTLGFGTTPTSSDAVCVYSDGYLFKDYESEDFSSKTFEDKRPSMRTGDDAIELVGHFTFDDDNTFARVRDCRMRSGWSVFENIRYLHWIRVESRR
jgi:hypothetical protein